MNRPAQKIQYKLGNQTSRPVSRQNPLKILNLNTPMATSRSNRSLRDFFQKQHQQARSVSKPRAALGNLRVDYKSKERIPMGCITNKFGQVANSSVNCFSKISKLKSIKDCSITKQTLKTESDTSNDTIFKSSILLHNVNLQNIEKGRDRVLQQLLFGSSPAQNQYVIQDSQDTEQIVKDLNMIQPKRSQSLLISEGCNCGCRKYCPLSSGQPINKLKNRLNKHITQTVFDFVVRHVKNRGCITYPQVKQLLSRYLMANKISFRFQQLHSLVQQLYEANGQFAKGVCFRKLGLWLSNFTQPDRNCIYHLWKTFHRQFMSVGQIKAHILTNHSRKFYEQVRNAFKSIPMRDDQQISFWDLHLLKDTLSGGNLIHLLCQSVLDGRDFRISQEVPQTLLRHL